MKENDKVINWNDECPEHKTELKSEYEFGNKMHPSMVVCTFSGCKCAVSNRNSESRYHTSYTNAKASAILQKAMDRN